MSRNYDGPHLNPGDRYTVIGLDGERHDDNIVHSIRYRSEQPEVRNQPHGWRRILRSFAPRRWRKSLPIVRPPHCSECGRPIAVGAATEGRWLCEYCLVIDSFDLTQDTQILEILHPDEQPTGQRKKGVIGETHHESLRG